MKRLLIMVMLLVMTSMALSGAVTAPTEPGGTFHTMSGCTPDSAEDTLCAQ